MGSEKFDSVWIAVATDPVEAKILNMRSDLMSEIRDFISAKALTQAEAAQWLGLTQPRVSDLLWGKLSKFNLEILIGLAERCGVSLELRKSHALAQA